MYNYTNPLLSPTYPVPVVVGHYIDRIQKCSRFMINFHCLADVFSSTHLRSGGMWKGLSGKVHSVGTWVASATQANQVLLCRLVVQL